MKIHVGRLPPEVTEDHLQREFAAYGVVTSVKIMRDPISGESRGFGFVVMPSTAEAESAIEGLSGRMLAGQAIFVEAARSRSDRGHSR